MLTIIMTADFHPLAMPGSQYRANVTADVGALAASHLEKGVFFFTPVSVGVPGPIGKSPIYPGRYEVLQKTVAVEPSTSGHPKDRHIIVLIDMRYVSDK